MLIYVFFFALPLSGAGGCQPLQFSAFSNVRSPPGAQNMVSFELEPGPLQPQIEKLLSQHLDIQSVVWRASRKHTWPSQYQAQAPSWDALLERLMAPYNLSVRIHLNHTAVIDYIPALKGAL